MKFSNLKISAQLIIGFAGTLILVLVMGAVSNCQTDRINDQTTMIYEHPMKVQLALGNLKNDILKMRLGTRDLMLATNADEKRLAIQLIDLAKVDVHIQFDSLHQKYLGSPADLEAAQIAFTNWNSAREENTVLAKAGSIDKVKESISQNGAVGTLRNIMLEKIDRIDTYAKAKSASIYKNSIDLNDSLDAQLLWQIIGIILIMAVLSFILIRNIRNPIKELVRVTNEFKSGNYDAKSSIYSTNEFGILSKMFNEMVEDIKQNYQLTEKMNKMVNAMLSVENSHTFFLELLPALTELTQSQMAAVYLLNEEKTQFYHYESIGLDAESTKQTFRVDSFEGEFGKALSTRKIQHICNIPKDTTFVFQSVSGKYIPREIITIPIIANNEIVAIISLSSLRNYNNEVVKLLNVTFEIMTARIEGILLYRQSRKISRKLEIQNSELEAQKIEMESQSIELKEQNRELEMQKIQLNEANRLKTNFLSNMSHELRTPLNSVIALSGVLNRRLANKIPIEEYSYLEVIERNGKHLLTLINDVLDISRIEAGKEEVEISKFSANDMISELVSMIQPQANQKNIELEQNESLHKVYLTSDIHKCRHIMQNLIANAVKFTEKGKVEIEIVQKSELIEISVTDSGIGISSHHLAHIFDEFRQADSSTSRRYGGTGLGLAIAKKYANLLGGNISVKSVEGEGSVFTLSLPINYSTDQRIIDEPIPHFKKPQVSQVAPADNHKTILLVDDSEPAIIQMNDFLVESGYKILKAHNGEEALQIISETIPDAMILDLMMPGIDGFEVLKTIREADQTAHIPVLILTAKQITKEDLKFLKRNNVHQLIQKGDVNRDELLSAVASLVFVEKVEISQPKRTLNKIKGKPNVLVVEDNSDNMTTVKAILGENYSIFEAVDGLEGIKLAKTKKPDLILMDIALPGINGIEAFKTIRQIGELGHIPVIALTASAMTTERETILSHGFDGYIAKPIDEKDFFDTINQVLYGK
jgi:signal transduction histidine kinase/DNA-binding response OmpR family regulator